MFIGRNSELKLLFDAYNSNKSELVVLYGRRRIGKSALVHQFLDKIHVRSFRFEALEEENTKAQIEHFKNQLAQYYDEPLLKKFKFENWEDTFEYFTRNSIEKSSTRKKKIIFLDEVQWMAARRKALISLLKFFWDNKWKQNNVMLILCGSISSFMLKNIIRSKALYGRTTLELNLKGLEPEEVKQMFLNKRSKEEVLRYLFVFGGVPKYIELINLKQSFNQNINTLCFNKNALMLQEMHKIFHSQFKKSGIYLQIVELLHDKKCTQKEISDKINIPSGGGLKSYLQNLIDANLVEKRVSFGKQESSKMAKYVVSDEFLTFYLTFIKPHMKTITTSKSNQLFEQLTDKRIDAWFGYAFENFCLKNAWYLANLMGFADSFLSAASYFEKDPEANQIDLIYTRSDKVITICEIKHQNTPISTTVIPQVERQKQRLAIKRGYTLDTALITLYGPDKSLKDSGYFHYYVTLDDILG